MDKGPFDIKHIQLLVARLFTQTNDLKLHIAVPWPDPQIS